MKINDLLTGMQEIKKNTKSGANGVSSGGVDFQKLLEDQLQGGSPVSPTKPMFETMPVAPLASASPALRVEGLSLSEAAIEDLESFGAALQNKMYSADDLAPYVDAMEDKVVGLLSVKDQLPPGDQLGTLLDRVATVTYLEAAKYRRGDYSV